MIVQMQVMAEQIKPRGKIAMMAASKSASLEHNEAYNLTAYLPRHYSSF